MGSPKFNVGDVVKFKRADVVESSVPTSAQKWQKATMVQHAIDYKDIEFTVLAVERDVPDQIKAALGIEFAYKISCIGGDARRAAEFQLELVDSVKVRTELPTVDMQDLLSKI